MVVSLEAELERVKRYKNIDSEKVIEKKCIEFAERLGWFQVKMNPLNRNGLPDRIFLKGGNFFLIEFKSKGRRLTALQKQTCETLFRDHNIGVYICDNLVEGLTHIYEQTHYCNAGIY